MGPGMGMVQSWYVMVHTGSTSLTYKYIYIYMILLLMGLMYYFFKSMTEYILPLYIYMYEIFRYEVVNC